MREGLYLPGDTDLYCLTAEEYSRGRNNIEVVGEMIKAGVKIIQYREKEKEIREKYEECKRIREMTKQASVTFLIDDSVDLAMVVGADGVHIGQDDLPIAEVRNIASGLIIGVSTHSPEQAQKAVSDGADYIGVGPIYSTKTKKNVCDAVGLSYLDYVVKNFDIPYVAIGGIKAHNVGEIKAHGASCVALVTEIVGAVDIPKKIQEIREQMEKAR